MRVARVGPVLGLALAMSFGTACAPPRAGAVVPEKPAVGTVVRETPSVGWLNERLDELARADALRGAQPLAQVELGPDDSELRVWIRTPARRGVVQVRRTAAGVTGESWVFWSAPDQEEDDGVFAEYRDWIDCVDRRTGHGLGMCRPQFRKPIDWVAVEAQLQPAWTLPDQAKFIPPAEVDGELVIVERRRGARGEVIHWDNADPVESGPGAAEAAKGTRLWEVAFDVFSLAEPPE